MPASHSTRSSTPRTADDRLVAGAWGRHSALLETLAARLQIPVATALAVLCVESGGAGFGTDGRLKIRFENHVFWMRWGCKTSENESRFRERLRFHPQRRWLGHAYSAGLDEARTPIWKESHRSQRDEWTALEIARALDDTQALCSTSMGCAQLMGYHHARAGFASVQSMFAAFQDAADGEAAQVRGMFAFLQEASLLSALRGDRFEEFARLYNGSGQAAFYAARLVRFREAFERVRASGTSP